MNAKPEQLHQLDVSGLTYRFPDTGRGFRMYGSA